MPQKLLRLVRSEADSGAQAEQIVTTRTPDAAVPATPAHILHRYASADVPCCAYRVPSAASGLLYSSCGRNRRYPHRCRSRHRNSTMKPSHCRSRIRSPSRPGHIRVRPGFYANSISSQMIFVSIKSDGRIPRCAGPAGASNRMCTS